MCPSSFPLEAQQAPAHIYSSHTPWQRLGPSTHPFVKFRRPLTCEFWPTCTQAAKHPPSLGAPDPGPGTCPPPRATATPQPAASTPATPSNDARPCCCSARPPPHAHSTARAATRGRLTARPPPHPTAAGDRSQECVSRALAQPRTTAMRSSRYVRACVCVRPCVGVCVWLRLRTRAHPGAA